MERIVAESHEIEITEHYMSVDIADAVPLVNSIREKTDKLSPISPDCCIYRVPKRLRDVNERAYIPQVVSIGPFHHSEENLQAMEENKLRYLQAFLNRSGLSLERCIGVIKEWEETARKYYSESIKLSSDEFVEMLLLDSSFIIETIWRYHFSSPEEAQTNYLTRPSLRTSTVMDLILLENQLPFFVLEGLFNLAFLVTPQTHSFLSLAIYFFQDLCLVEGIDQSILNSIEVKHFVDLLRLLHLPSSPRSKSSNGGKFVAIRNVTELQEAGMKFRTAKSNHLLDLRNTKEVLEIPLLTLGDGTESVLRNLFALEQCHYYYDSYITDYIFLMDNLIDTAKDADLLIQNGVITSFLSDSATMAGLFNGLTTEVALWIDNYYFYNICEKLNAYCKVSRHKWRATLTRDYFSTPWITASTIAAVILLGLTLIQTICSLVSL
ncbi:UPF0481 protein At3g47200-like [Cornus florida]|uniref:UPF0481 protein At3g47200-like n=1 Tax=Cornus florida TaxID=4283 RepID=UPI00289CEE14|nr:UPF0481 protein At3g47200-like [Cornus florida]XP_059638458.1 UPF0481 protein At3g47200-like [Cornus florida]XP_059638459.1 UPF0481 protein At3g47200-like [Cornus florida]XP_059638460.1 UPF0481 protein At3g47200-like [Cornus florida]XP_059638461.1 UPF0481 protein At3g47200-like [Cornus florida]XP_059638462.1 UPF0481 protein At3g47200-like [Cornus florida]